MKIIKSSLACLGLMACTTACQSNGRSSVTSPSDISGGEQPPPGVDAPDPEYLSASDLSSPDAADEQADRDGDGIFDASDACPDQAENENGYQDQDGCPDEASAEPSLTIDEEVLFAYDSAKLREGGKDKLEEIVQELESHEEWSSLRVAGHADQRGPDAYNEELSRERAKSVRQYFVKQGIDDEKIDLKAYGEEKPAIENADAPSEFAKNRRVEFKIVH